MAANRPRRVRAWCCQVPRRGSLPPKFCVNRECRSLENEPNNLAGVCTPWVVKSETSFCIAERSGVPVPEVLVVGSPDLCTLLVA